MANSIELRVPFLDHEMVELSYRLPPMAKIKMNYLSPGKSIRKYVLKDILKGKIPDNIIHRKKMGFPSPENDWLDEGLRSYIEDLVLSKDSLSSQVMNRKNLEKYFRKSEGADEIARSKIWLLSILEVWHKVFFIDQKYRQLS
jgi:asparagine synthase (glutamine-hydrolysing)